MILTIFILSFCLEIKIVRWMLLCALDGQIYSINLRAYLDTGV